MNYTPPKPADLRDLKTALDFTGKQMAELCGLAGDQQWRKYTGGTEPREISAQMLFFAAARIELDPATLERVLERMRQWGAHVDLTPPAARLDVLERSAHAEASDQAGVDWWNGMNEAQRRAALTAAQTASPGEAWQYFGRKGSAVA